MAFRYGGEEFAVLLPDTDENGALQVAEILRTSVEQLTEAATVSVGIATYSKDNQMRFRTPGELIEASDKALYEAKNTGKNRVVAWTPSLSSQE
jgi:diguanylate cyclase (GGDEF)-like protein